MAAVELFDAGRLDVGAGHVIAYFQRGNPAGVPVLSIHGGPGSCSSAAQAALFNLDHFRVVQFDQRGCGLSAPGGSIAHNQTDLLLDDIERLRHHLAINRWLIAGGSWGATLAVLSAARRPGSAAGLLLRAPFLCRRSDIAWFFENAAPFYPEPWRGLARAAGVRDGAELLPAMLRIFQTGPADRQQETARAWHAWEQALAGLAPAVAPAGNELASLIRRYRLQSHYLARQCWLQDESLLDAAGRLRDMPTVILQGLHDSVCRPAGAATLQRALPGSILMRVPCAGHDPFHPAMRAAMVRATARFAAV